MIGQLYVGYSRQATVTHAAGVPRGETRSLVARSLCGVRVDTYPENYEPGRLANCTRCERSAHAWKTAPTCPGCKRPMTYDEGAPMQTAGPSSAWEPEQPLAWFCEHCGTEQPVRTGRNLKPDDHPTRDHEYERSDERPGAMQGEPPCGICGEPRDHHAGWGNR